MLSACLAQLPPWLLLTAAVRVQLHALLSKLRGVRELCMDTGCMVPSALASLRQRCPHVALCSETEDICAPACLECS